MNRSGRNRGRQRLLVIALLCMAVLPAVALALEASVDRYRVNVGDSLQLTVSSDGGVDPGEADLAPLERDFEILQRSTSSSIRAVNGRTTRELLLELEITPRREGSLTIPSLTAGGEQTAPLTIEAVPAPALADPDATVVFSAEVDSDRVYVQEQVLLTLRVQQAIGLDDRSVTELELEDAFVVNLGQNSFQRDDGDRRWLVHEIRYAIFPEQSGRLEIPAQTFAARVRQGSRSLFDLRSGPRLTRRSEPIGVTVRAQPDGFPGQTWLPATDLTLEESWSRPPDSLATGESVTRTVTITGTGLQGAQLPPLEQPGVPGLKVYPDQPQIEDAEGAGGVIGVRTDSVALVPVAPGRYRIPAVRVPWWDTASDELRFATLPERIIEVGTAPGPGATAAAASAAGAAQERAPRAAGGDPGSLLWPVLAAACAMGWIATALLWWFSRRQTPGADDDASPPPGEARAWKQLRAALAAGEPAACRRQLAAWLQTLPGAPRGLPLGPTARALGASDLAAAADQLDAALYGPGDVAWEPAPLADAARALRGRRGLEARTSGGDALPPLYPTGDAAS